MFVQLLLALILFVLPIVGYLYAQKKWNTLRNHAVFMVFIGLIFTWTLYVPLHEVGHVIFANLSGIQVTEIVLFFVSETGIRKPAVGLNIDNIDNPLFTLRYVASWAGGILMVSLIFSFLSILLYFRRREVLYFSILPILKSFFETDDLNAISTLIRNWIVPYFVLCGSLLLLIHFFKMSSMLKKEEKVPNRLMFSLSATTIFAVLFWINPFYDIALFISPLGVCLSQIRMILVIQILGWILIAPSTIFIIILLPWVRRKLKEIDLSDNGRKKKIADFYETHLHLLVLVRQILLLLIPTAVVMVLPTAVSILSKHFLSLIVSGLSILIFVSIQLPLLMKAHILITFKIDGEEQSSRINFRSGKTTYVESGIHNLGFSTYKNFTIVFYFGGDFEILPYDDPLYTALDFKKKFHVQRRHGGILFNPKDNFLTIPPQEVFVFPMWVKVPNKEKEGKMEILFFSENTWGMNRITRQISVRR